ncbi:AMP-binding protein [Pseudomonas ovata]|uniref:AMP-binding protein n=1 Tax=Pseudomonas ovata TaxID=1839709 RepID=UPI000D69D64D|nr:AMP-binding protein [Pseudomonas ovata]
MSPELEQFHLALQAHAECTPHALALWGDDLKLDYAALYAEVTHRQQRLRAEDARVVALALDNGVEAMLWDLALLLEGLTCVPLPGFFTPAQRQHCLVRSAASLVIAEPALATELQAAGYTRRGDFWHRSCATDSLMPAGTAKLTFTSGTTGTPKGVCLSAASLLRVASALHEACALTEPRHHLALLPLAVLLENLGCYAALLAGATLSVPGLQTLGIQGASSVDAPRLLKVLVERAPESVILVPQLLLLLVSAAEQRAFNPTTLRFAAVGGARVSTALLMRAQRLGMPLYEGYGLSECASVVCLNQPQACRPGSAGRPLPHLQVRLADDGEVLIKGALMLGYLGEPPRTDEWWPSGDLGELDSDGFLYLKGRKKYQFITSFGRNVNPEWVEAELTQRGVIAQAFVHGEAMPRNHALLWPCLPDCSDEQLATAVAHANHALPDYARIHRWSRLDQPFTPGNGLLTANGRPRRDAIIERYHPLLTAEDLPEEIAP